MSRYNGWKNYETWAVHLWLTNEEGSQSYWADAAREAKADAADGHPVWSKKQHARFVLADRLKDEIRQDSENAVPSGTLWADLMNSALEEVEWADIARALLAE